MLRIHREGVPALILVFVFGLAASLIAARFLPGLWWIVSLAFLLLLLFMLQFFRNPARPIPVADNRQVYSPADGKVVVIEETEEAEYFGDRRLQISIFMSIWDVHANRNPVGGTVRYLRHHPGRYLVAWHPKSSKENEHTSIVIDNGHHPILLRQIAGAVARRIHNYLKENQTVEQGGELGFIKFGSRVDLFLPPGAEVQVEIGQQVKGNVDILAALPE